MGELTEHSDLISATGQRTRTTGTDHIWSEKRFQRHREQEVAQHGKRVVDALHDLFLRTPFDRLIIAGPTEATSQVARLLPRRLHGKLAETVSMSTSASPQEMLQKVLEVERQMELEQELLVVEGVLAELHEGGKAVSGTQAVVDAVNQGRVWKLVYVKGHTAQGSVCKACGLHSHRRTGPCKACGGKVQVVPGFVEALSQAVLDVGGQVEVVSGSAAEKLGQQAPIAALLRY
jgi:peptide subunit release factor 1 (eRF1)